MLGKAALHKGLMGVGQAKGCDVPGHEFCARGDVQMQQVLGLTLVIGQCFQGQPFQPRTGLQLQVGDLLGHSALGIGFVKASGPRRSDQGMGPSAYAAANVQRVTADQSSGRVDEYVVADAIAFGVEAA